MQVFFETKSNGLKSLIWIRKSRSFIAMLSAVEPFGTYETLHFTAPSEKAKKWEAFIH
jgi:hypothetical protein